MTTQFFLRQLSEPAVEADLPIARDLADTLAANLGGCIGMAANMIGERKRIIAFVDGSGEINVMINPEITSAENEYLAEEGCLSLPGKREAKRFRRIEMRWQDEEMQPQSGSFEGWVAQVIQHEVDHCNGVLI